MQLLYSRNPWSLQYGPDPTINFCFWVLQVDGLRVPPFDQHQGGDGALRDLGLTEASWRAWFYGSLIPNKGNKMKSSSSNKVSQHISRFQESLTWNTSVDDIKQSSSRFPTILPCHHLPKCPSIMLPGEGALRSETD